MPRKLSNALTPLSVKNAKPGRHADGAGLHLLVKDTGARSWVYRFMLNGKSRDLGLGPASGADAISLAVARDLAAVLRLKVKAGVDPLEERQIKAAEELAAAQAASVAGVTFKAVAEAYIAANKASWRNAKHRQQWSNTLVSYVYPVKRQRKMTLRRVQWPAQQRLYFLPECACQTNSDDYYAGLWMG